MEFSETVSRATLRKNAAALNASLYMIELVGDMLAQADPYPGVFDLLHKAIGRLGDEGVPVGAVLAYFQWRLLRHAGLLGGLTTCVGCGMGVSEIPRQAQVYFSSQQGGILCDGCQDVTTEKFQLERVTLEGLATLAAAEAGQRGTLPQVQAGAVNRLLAYHIAQQLGKTLRMARYVISRK